MSKNEFIEEERDETGRLIIHGPSEIPQNMAEEEEHKFWRTHSLSEELIEISIVEDDELPPPRRSSSSTKPINLRIETDLLKRLQIKRLQNIAEIKKIPYQTLLKQFVAERVYEEEKREKVL